MRVSKEDNNDKRAYKFIGFLLILIVGLIGIYFSNSQAVFYNAIIMPCVGILGVFVLGKRFYWLPISTAILSYIVIIIQSILDDMERLRNLVEMLLLPLFFTIIFTILVTIGMGIVLLFKYALSKESRTTNSRMKRIIAGALGVLLSSMVIGGANDLLGNPISAMRAAKEVRVYVEKNYPNLDLEILNTTYNFKFKTYMVNISSPSGLDTHFYIEYRNGKVIYDSYQSSVEEKWNTMQRLEERCTSDVLNY